MKTVNNTIEDSYCSFELSKLLKERGMYLDPVTNTKHGHPVLIHKVEGIRTCNIDLWNNGLGGHPKTEKQKWLDGDDEYADYVQKITLSLAQKWVYENFGIWVYIKLGYGSEFVIQEGKSPFNFIYSDGTYNSLQEALEAGLIYTLKELI